MKTNEKKVNIRITVMAVKALRKKACYLHIDDTVCIIPLSLGARIAKKNNLTFNND